MRSFLKFHYAVRPAKHVERLLIVEMLREWTRDKDPTGYRYVGMGSVYFVDYLLFHRDLGTQEMWCYEIASEYRKRMEFNKPFECVTVIIDDVHEAVNSPNFSDKPTIVWLDYDFLVSRSILEQIRPFVRNLAEGSILMITTDARLRTPLGEDDMDDVSLLKYFNDSLGDYAGYDFVPKGDDQFQFGRFLIDGLRGVVADEAVLRGRDAKQIMSFVYADGAEMATVGFTVGKIAPEVGEAIARTTAYRDEKSLPFEIPLPILTFKEKQWLERKITGLSAPKDVDFEIGESELNAMKLLYRYYPSFSEVRL